MRLRFSVWLSIVYVALTVLLAYPLSIHPGSVVTSPGTDTNLFMWTLAWDTHGFLHRPWAIFEANIFYPFHLTLAFSENLIGSAFLAAPVLWISHNPVLAMNLVALVSSPLCAIGAYLLGRRIGLGPLGAAICGLIYAFAPPRFLRIDQLHLTTVQWIPFGLAFFHSYLDRGRARDLRVAIAFFSLQALTSGHGAVFLAFAMAGLAVFSLAAGDSLGPVRRLRDIGWAGVLLLVPVVLMALPYRSVQVHSGLRRDLVGWEMPWQSFVASPTHVHQMIIGLMPGFHINEKAEAYLFPGILPLIVSLAAFHRSRRAERATVDPSRWAKRAALILELVALVALALGLALLVRGPFKLRAGDLVLVTVREVWRPLLLLVVAAGARLALVRRAPLAPLARVRQTATRWRRWAVARRHDMALFYGLIVLACVWLSVGPPFGIWQAVYWLPGLNFIRAPSRFMLLAVLGLGVLAGLGFERLTARLGPRRRAACAIALSALLVAEFSVVPFGVSEMRVDVPAIDRWLDSQPKPFVVAEVPVTDRLGGFPLNRHESIYMLHAMGHWQKTVHGYSGLLPPESFDVYRALATFPDKESIAMLEQWGVDYVVVHPEFYDPADWPGVDARLGETSGLLLQHIEGQGRVYAVASRAAGKVPAGR
jgi:hypothetical protein